MACSILRPMRGSPPRVRGKVDFIAHKLFTFGITPAYAGKSQRRRGSEGARGDHPRVCGEKTSVQVMVEQPKGSPPRVRGKDTAVQREPFLAGITPARAGKRKTREWILSACRDHPRVCGEKWCTDLGDGCDWGSPPHMRGKVSAGKILLHDGGITPACAGKRADYTGKTPKVEGHPRMCGEKVPSAPPSERKLGSPPRMQGKAAVLAQRLPGLGITPAYAGKSKSLPSPHTGSKDHPRVCGEKTLCPGPYLKSKGSPPRVRGKVPSSI